MNPYRTRCLIPLMISAFLLLIALALPATFAAAQTSTPQVTATGPAASPAASQPITATVTVTATRTPAPTPTATPTLTALQNTLLLGQTYLKGKEYAKAAGIFEGVLQQDRGNAEALKGLQDALSGQASATATAEAPKPTAVLAQPTPVPAPGFFGALAGRVRDFAGTALAGLLFLLIVYALAKAIRPLLMWAREFLLVVLPTRFGRKPVNPPFLIGKFTDATGIKRFDGAAIVTQALTERLLAWSEPVSKWAAVVEPAPSLELGGMAWIKVLWTWIYPPPRGYEVTGLLLANAPDGYQLAVQRVARASNSVDASYTFAVAGQDAAEAFRALAQKAALWLHSPADVAALLGRQPAAQATAKGAAAEGAPIASRRTPGRCVGRAAQRKEFDRPGGARFHGCP